jgi:hypothetical protein
VDSDRRRGGIAGVGAVLVAVYAIMALAATGSSFVQIARNFAEAPLAYALSALAAVVYILATLALVFSRSRGWYVTAWVAIGVELAGVITVGSLSLVFPGLFPHDTVWSLYGRGYVFVPLVLPFLGLWWLATRRPEARAAARAGRDAA